MKVEIDNIREVKEVVISSDGSIISQLPEYAGYVAKIVILEQKGKPLEILKTGREERLVIEKPINSNIIEGKRYVKGQKRSRKTAKNFVRLISNKFDILDKNQSWIYLKNGMQIRYANSVVYDGSEGDYLWYSISYESLSNQMKKGKTILTFIIRESRKLIYINADDVIKELKAARDIRNNDWLHVNLIFINGKIRFYLKTGKDNKPIEKEFGREKHYLNWQEFARNLEEKEWN